jgi:hypothetical protein
LRALDAQKSSTANANLRVAVADAKVDDADRAPLGESMPFDTERLAPHPSPLPAGEREPDASPFERFLKLSDWLFDQTGRQHGISLSNLAELLFRFLVEENKLPPSDAAAAIWADYQRVGRSDRPAFLKDLVPAADTRKIAKDTRAVSRQQRHLAK